ncbi:MAG: hypothetical protein WAN30_05915 [Acidimicrobiales bacterium]
MAPPPRTTHQRDRRFARVRRLTQTVFLGSGVVSGLFVAYAASTAKPAVTVVVPSSTTTTTTTPSATTDTTTTTVPTTPTSVATTTTTTCYSTPSGHTTCN